jgi:hypothetical protein
MSGVVATTGTGTIKVGQSFTGVTASGAAGNVAAMAATALQAVSGAGDVGNISVPNIGVMRAVSATGVLGALVPGQAISGVAGTSAVGSLVISNSENLVLTGVRAASALGTLFIQGSNGTIALTWPVPVLKVATSDIRAVCKFTLPTPQILISGSVGNIGSVAFPLKLKFATAGGGNVAAVSLRVPRLQLASVGDVGLMGSVALTLPSLRLAMAHASSAALVLGTPRLAISGTTGTTGAVILRMSALRLATTVLPAFTGSVVLRVAALRLAVGALTGSVGTGGTRMALPRLALAVAGYSGIVGDVGLTWPALRLAATAYQPVLGVVRLTLPKLRLVATGRVTTGTAPLTVAMHTETMALTTYSNYPFNSFATFNGVFLGAAPTGIFALSGADDAGVPIDAAARGGSSDFSTSHRKRVDRVYVGYRADGDMILRVFTDEIHVRDYRLRATGRPGLHGNHVRLGKGLVSRYWQFELRNVDGADFQMNMIELEPTTLPRRVGGGDA